MVGRQDLNPLLLCMNASGSVKDRSTGKAVDVIFFMLLRGVWDGGSPRISALACTQYLEHSLAWKCFMNVTNWSVLMASRYEELFSRTVPSH